MVVLGGSKGYQREALGSGYPVVVSAALEEVCGGSYG